MTDNTTQFINAIHKHFPSAKTLNRADLRHVKETEGLQWPSSLVRSLKTSKHNTYSVPAPVPVEDDIVSTADLKEVAKSVASKTPKKKVEEIAKSNTLPNADSLLGYIPDVDKTYVKFGHHKDIVQILKSNLFYPIFVTGLSGNGKTFGVEQACAETKRELVRVNITIETDEDDLLGGFRLENGETVFHKGPVVEALERGAVLLLDEVDLASSKILCLQPILEGKGVFLKKINEWVHPADGFTIIATANTKGKGSESGAFVGTNVLNEAFIDRFAITLEQAYPPVTTETRIIKNVFKSLGVKGEDDFATHLVNWADITRKTFYDGGVDEIIATRRLVHIANAFAIFKDRLKAVELCISRFDEDTKLAFKDLYEKCDSSVGEQIPAVKSENLDVQPF